MTDRSRFTLELTVVDKLGLEPPISMAIEVDQALRISTRAVSTLKAGSALGVSSVSLDQAVKLMQTREVRRDLLRQTATQLAGQLADRLEDAEGWHDPSRVEPARKSLGGSWE